MCWEIGRPEVGPVVQLGLTVPLKAGAAGGGGGEGRSGGLQKTQQREAGKPCAVSHNPPSRHSLHVNDSRCPHRAQRGAAQGPGDG